MIQNNESVGEVSRSVSVSPCACSDIYLLNGTTMWETKGTGVLFTVQQDDITRDAPENYLHKSKTMKTTVLLLCLW